MSFSCFALAKPADIPSWGYKQELPSSVPGDIIGVDDGPSLIDSTKPTVPTQSINSATTASENESKDSRFTFINTESRQSDTSHNRKIVRSQAARLRHDSNNGQFIPKKRKKTSGSNRTVTFRIEFRIKEACARARKRIEAPPTPPPSNSNRENSSRSLTRSPNGGWSNPFAWPDSVSNSCAPLLFHHYLTELAVDIPELDHDGPSGLLRSRWFPMALTEPATSAVILLTAGSHYAMMKAGTKHANQLLLMKTETLNNINEMLRDPLRGLTDQAIAAVAKLASYEAMFGSKETYLVHMDGLKRMIRLRGGMESLGLGGLLTRMLLWIDTNAAWLIRTPLYFALHERDPGDPLPPPNPGMFLGAA